MGEPAAAGGFEYDIQLTTPPPPPSCPICMDPWTCNSDHRICCIPCGQVYGRSCLETWLHRSGPHSAECPQCGAEFCRDVIINLYAPGNLRDGCCRIQEVKERSVSILKDHNAKCESRIIEIWEEALAEIEKRKANEFATIEEMWAESKKQIAALRDRMMAQMKSLMAEMKSLTDGMERTWRDKMSMVNASLTSMKEQMKKMSREENTMAADVVEFMERSFPELSQISCSPFSATASASTAAPPDVDSENALGHLNHLLLKPIPDHLDGLLDVKRKRHRET